MNNTRPMTGMALGGEAMNVLASKSPPAIVTTAPTTMSRSRDGLATSAY